MGRHDAPAADETLGGDFLAIEPGIEGIAMGRAIYNAALVFWQEVADDPMPDRRSA